MIATSMRARIALATMLAIAGCATVPPGPPPDVVRLENDLDRLHADPVLSANGGPELANADAAVNVLARNARTLPPREYQQGVYIAGKLVDIAEASAMARAAEQRGAALGAERDRLLARGAPVPAPAPEVPLVASSLGEPVPAARAELLAMQGRLSGLESRVDERGLVVTIGNFMFDPSRSTLTPEGEHSLDSLALALRRDGDATADIWGYGADGVGLRRAATVRDYLNARGVEVSRLDVRGAGTGGSPPGDRRVDVVVRTEYR